jgi:predicted MPP superfamily phosphohydrolase
MSVEFAEKLRALLFISAVAVIYVLAASIFVRFVIHKLGGKSLPDSRKYLWIRRIILSLAAFGVLCFAYGYFIEPYWPEVTHVNIKHHKIPGGSRPIRIVHISDIHSDPKPRLENRLPEIIAAEKPDLIVYTGDSINSRQSAPVFKECINRISAIAPAFVVKGNWDSTTGFGIEVFKDTGAQELDRQAVRIEIEGVPLWIGGAPVNRLLDIEQIFSAAPANEFKLFLYHYPDAIEEAAQQRIDLYCAGHTHGGQVALPFYGAIITLSKFGKKYESGLYRIEDTWAYVNRGIGMEGGPAPRVRFCARPEITVIELSPAD